MDKFEKRKGWVINVKEFYEGEGCDYNVKEFYKQVISEACNNEVETTEITDYNERETCNLNENYNPSFNIRAFSHLYRL